MIFSINETEENILSRISRNECDLIIGLGDNFKESFWKGVTSSATNVEVSVLYATNTIDSTWTDEKQMKAKIENLLGFENFFRDTKDGNKIIRVVKQNLDYSIESSENLVKEWQDALGKIPLNPKKYHVNQDWGILGDKMRHIGLNWLTFYEFFEVDDDTWAWLYLLFKEDGKVELDVHSNYSIRDEEKIRNIVDTFFQEHEIKMCLDGQNPDYKDLTYQEAYELLCNISQKKYVIPKGEFIDQEEEI